MSAKDKPVSKPATDAYRDNYDNIFKKEPEMTPRIKNMLTTLPEITDHINGVDKVLDAAYELFEDLRLNASLTREQHDRIKTVMIRMEQF